MINKINNEVFYSTESLPIIKRSQINLLVKQARKNKSQKSRLCTHKNTRDKLHEMFVVHTNKYKVKPHYHLNKCESLHVLYGSADLIIFDKLKKIKKKIVLGTYNSGKIFYYRIKKKVIHSLDVKSKYFIFHEVTLGPFVKKHTIYK
jgi:cupin fold WbuC family metalloprotein